LDEITFGGLIMKNSQNILQEMIDIVNGDKQLRETFLSDSANIPTIKGGIAKVLRWLYVQDFVGDIEIIEHDRSFSSIQIIQLINSSNKLQKYFQIRNGILAFSDNLSETEALDMIRYVKQNYLPQVNF
jgi:hypothetical protein